MKYNSSLILTKHGCNDLNLFSKKKDLNHYNINYSFQSEIAHLADFLEGTNPIKKFKMLLDHSKLLYYFIEVDEFEDKYFKFEDKQFLGKRSFLNVTINDNQQILVDIKCINKLKFSGSRIDYFWMDVAEIEKLNTLQLLTGISIWIIFREEGRIFVGEDIGFYCVALTSIVDFSKELSRLFDDEMSFGDINVLRIPNEILIKSNKKNLFNHNSKLDYSVLEFFQKKSLDHFRRLKKEITQKRLKKLNMIEILAFFYKENKGYYSFEEIKFHLDKKYTV